VFTTLFEIIFLNLDLAGSALCWTVAHLAEHKDCQDRIFEEMQHMLPGQCR
jgi:hypothetical protein